MKVYRLPSSCVATCLAWKSSRAVKEHIFADIIRPAVGYMTATCWFASFKFFATQLIVNGARLCDKPEIHSNYPSIFTVILIKSFSISHQFTCFRWQR